MRIMKGSNAGSVAAKCSADEAEHGGSLHQVSRPVCGGVVAGMLRAGMGVPRLHAFTSLCVCPRTVMGVAEVGVASLCGTRSREQVGSGWSRESVLIVFVPQSCSGVVRATSTSREANCSVYTGRRFPLSFLICLLFYSFSI